MKRISALQRAALDVCQFLLEEGDLPNLLQGVCDRLLTGGLHRSALLVLCDREAGALITAEAGLGERLGPISALLQQGALPDCGTRVLESDAGPVITCQDCRCGVCQGDGQDAPPLALCASIRCSPVLAGFLTVQLPAGIKAHAAELRLLADLATAITRALRRIFANEAARRRELELQRVEERYELALHASQAGLWDWNIRTGEMHTSPDQWELLDYRSGSVDNGEGQRHIHPDDKEAVLAVLNEHLSGRSDEYRIEYRVREKDGQWSWFLDRGRVVERDENNMPVRMTGTHQNITHQKLKDQALAAIQQQLHDAVDHERNFLQTVIDSAGDPVMVIDLDFHLLLINKTAARLVRWQSDGAILGEKCYRLFRHADEPCTDPHYPCPVAQVRAKPVQAKLVHNPYHGNGINNTFEMEVSPLRDSRGQLYGIIEVARDITDRLRIEKELLDSQSRLYRLAHHDTLTGLPNRLLFRDRLSQAMSKARRNRTSVAVLFLDLDRFKAINDTLGHDIGDLLLVEVAHRLQRQCRQSDTVARLGGDEFVFVLDDIVNREDSTVVAAKIMAALTRPVRANNHELHVSTSIGIALFPDDSDDIDGVIKCADIALYHAKEVGRSNFQLYRQDLEHSARRPKLREQQLRRALETGQLFVDYQPQRHLATGRLAGFAARLRWRHPEMGVLFPADFSTLVDEAGLGVEVGGWFIGEVCAALVAWAEACGRVLPVTVPCTASQIEEERLVRSLETLMARHRLAPDLVVIESAEGVVAAAGSRGLEHLAAMARLGCGLSMDDFDGERCPPARLRQLPLTRLGLSRILINRLPHDPEVAALVRALIDLGHTFGLPVLADGVEAEDQRAFLRQHRCDQAQGMLLGQMVDRAAVMPLLTAAEDG